MQRAQADTPTNPPLCLLYNSCPRSSSSNSSALLTRTRPKPMPPPPPPSLPQRARQSSDLPYKTCRTRPSGDTTPMRRNHVGTNTYESQRRPGPASLQHDGLVLCSQPAPANHTRLTSPGSEVKHPSPLSPPSPHSAPSTRRLLPRRPRPAPACPAPPSPSAQSSSSA